MKLVGSTLGYEPVRHAEPCQRRHGFHSGLVEILAHPFKHRRAESTVDSAVLDCDYRTLLAEHFCKQGRIERFDEAHVIEGYAHARLALGTLDGT